jgi:hypothetical protein
MRALVLLPLLLVATPVAGQSQAIAPAPSVLFSVAPSGAPVGAARDVGDGSRPGNSLILTFVGAGTGYLLVAGADPEASAGATITGIAAGAVAGYLLGGGSLRRPVDTTATLPPDSLRPRMNRAGRVSRGAAIGGTAGVIVGYAIGSYLAQRPCACEDPGIERIIMPIVGGLVGAVVGASAADEP